MDIKIGFNDSPRELVISSDRPQDEIRAAVAEALAQDSGVLQLDDDKGRKYVLRNASVAYVEIGAATARTVGFTGV